MAEVPIAFLPEVPQAAGSSSALAGDRRLIPLLSTTRRRTE